MNILHVPNELVEEKKKEYAILNRDKLDILFAIGKNYMNKYGTNSVNIHTKDGQEQIRKIIFALTEELFEFSNTLKNKSWCISEYPVDEEHSTEELCDVLAFFIQLLLTLGYDSNTLMDTYYKKLIVNEFRLNSKY